MSNFILYNRPVVPAPVSGYIWDITKAGAGISLSNADRTADSSTTQHVVLSNLAIPLTGKYYWELAVVNTSGYSAPYIGVVGDYKDAPPKDYNTWAGPGDYSAQLAVRDNFLRFNGGFSASYADSPADDTFRFAYDADTRELWLGSVGLGIWFGGGDPSTPTTPTATLTADSYYMAVVPRVTTDFASVTMLTTVGEVLGSLPTGYSYLE